MGTIAILHSGKIIAFKQTCKINKNVSYVALLENNIPKKNTAKL